MDTITKHAVNGQAAGDRRYECAKRVLDVAVSTLVLAVLLPLLVAIAVIVRLDSPGPALLRQRRVGRNRRPFECLKFRSMAVDADRRRGELASLNEMSGPVFKIRNDPRITRVGRILRKYSLDELPQLVNVLRGEMSLVGPRPPLPEEVDLYEPRYLRRLDVTPGLTCLWQISGRNELGFERWMELDLYYVEHRSLLLDIEILLRTLPAVISARGAY